MIPINTQTPIIERALCHTKFLNRRRLICWLYMFTVYTGRLFMLVSGIPWFLVSTHYTSTTDILEHLPDVNGWRMLKAHVVKTCHDGSLYYEQKHMYTLCIPMSIFVVLLWTASCVWMPNFTCAGYVSWYAKMVCPVCTAIAWHLFAPAKYWSFYLSISMSCLRETWPSHYVYVNTRKLLDMP